VYIYNNTSLNSSYKGDISDKVPQKIEPHILCLITFSRKIVRYRRKYNKALEATDERKYALCMSDY